MCAFVTIRCLGLLDGASLRDELGRIRAVSKGSRVSAKDIYKGYTFADMSTQTDSGQYRARVAIMVLDGTRTRSQRFLDLELFRTRDEANDRAMSVAKTWIEENCGQDQLALPSSFSSLD